MDPELSEAPELPDCAAHLWAYFLQLHRARINNGFGPSALQYSDIEAWSRLTRTTLDPWELNAVLTLDSLFMNSLDKKPAS